MENHPFHLNTFSKGANLDGEKEIIHAEAANGVYVDGHNCRPVSNDGNKGSNEKIKGEQILYPNNKALTNYTCIGSENVKNHIVEFWAPNSGSGPGICVVDGVIVLKSNDFELRITHPLQITKNESFEEGEIGFTDNRVPPYWLSIKDMLDSLTSDPTRYFAAFDPLLYQVNLQSPLDRPAFIELINVGGGGGLPVGQYQYQMRYVTEEGDRTNWSMVTPLIPVVQGLSSESRLYPWIKTYGGPPAPSSVTAFAIKLRFRVTNLYNYNYIEIKRLSYNGGAGIKFVPAGKIVAKIAISPGEINIRDYIDPAESNTDVVLSPNDETQQIAEVETAKSIRYFDRRTVLMNVKLASRESDLEFLKIDDLEGFPVIDKLFTAGHKDPWNHAYKRAYMHGEKYGFAAALFDGVGTKAFATKIPNFGNYKFPNRRDPATSRTQNYSFDGVVNAADTSASNNVTRTHEVFDLINARTKGDICNFKNIVRQGKVLGLTGSRTTIEVKKDCDEDDGEIENHGANVTGSIVTCSYQPFSPVRQNDPDVTGHDYIVNTECFTDADNAHCLSADDKKFNYRPPGFAPEYYAQGIMFAGVDNFPKWAKAFSIVRTPAAKRVVCQGLGWYAMTQAKFKVLSTEELGGKEQNKVWFYSPDIEQGIVSSDTLNDIIANPQNYRAQMVSPLGFFSEVYGYENNTLACNRDRLIDMVSYVRMIRDLDSDPNNQINPDEDANMGVPGGDGYNYVAYDKYRNVTQNPNTFAGDPQKGNREVGISAVRRKVDGRGQFLELEFDQNIYGKAGVGGINDRHFGNAGLKDWTEPLYMINIVRTGANIVDQNIQKYQATDHYQKLESIIGRGTGLPGQKHLLVDERWEDCIPAPKSYMFGAGTDRFIYIKKIDGTYEKWINVTYKTTAQRSAITAAIIGAGYYTLGPDKIYGVYQHNNIEGINRFYEISFYHGTIFPDDQDLIIVKYDNTAPIRVYGGDTYVAETIFAPIDRMADAKDKAAENQFAWGIGLPYFKYKMNGRYYTIRKAGATFNVVQDAEPSPFGRPKLGFLRQLLAMFTCECRSGVHYAYNLPEHPNQFFPHQHYVIRPNRWDEDKNYADNGIFQDYQDDYDNEKDFWKYGGLRFLQQINPDYSCESPIAFFSKPLFGYVEKVLFQTRVMWSLQRGINVQDAPGLRTFPANNSFDIDDKQGEIKFAYDDTTEKGENIYAVTDKGICLLVTKKSILSDLNSGELGYMAADTFVKHQYWITKDIGMSDEMWRSAKEAYIAMPVGENSEVRKKALFFANDESVYRFMDNTAMDIARESYYTKVYNQGLKKVLPGYATHMTAGYNKLHREYWLHLKGEGVDNTFMYGQDNGYWYGTNDFKFDRFTSMGNRIFGHRNLETYELLVGYTVNGGPVEYRLLGASAPEQSSDKEFILIKVNSPQSQKPTEVNFYKEVGGAVQGTLSVAAQGPLYMKDYRGFQGHVPRILASVNPDRPLFQQRIIFFEIIHSDASAFKVIDTLMQYKVLKLK